MASSTDYPTYSGEATTCPKCGYWRASTSYVATTCTPDHTGEHMMVTSALGETDEHLCRRCLACGYQWDEACLS